MTGWPTGTGDIGFGGGLDGLSARDFRGRGLFARLTSRGGSAYGWHEVLPDLGPDGVWTGGWVDTPPDAAEFGRGTVARGPARESNGRRDVPCGIVRHLRPTAGGWEFIYDGQPGSCGSGSGSGAAGSGGGGRGSGVGGSGGGGPPQPPCDAVRIPVGWSVVNCKVVATSYIWLVGDFAVYTADPCPAAAGSPGGP